MAVQRSFSDTFDTVVIGGGPAGLAAAIAAAAAGAKVALIEQMSAPGRKLLVTGGGRCNLTNTLDASAMARAFGAARQFVRPALCAFTPEQLRDFFVRRSVPLDFPDGFHCFPRSGRARDILEVLTAEAEAAGVVFFCGSKAAEIELTAGQVSGVITGRGRLGASGVILASGGRSYPALGADGSGYALAAQLGHTVIPQVPGMVGLRTVEAWPALCTGISLPEVATRIDLPGEKQLCRGDLLFTHHGISAFAVLDISARVAELLEIMPEVPLRLDLFPGVSADSWQKRFQSWQQNCGSRPVAALLTEFLPRKVIAAIAPPAVGEGVTAARFSREDRRTLAGSLTALCLHINATDGWQKAQVTRGGVARDEVDSRSMVSRLVPGLFFAGEVLDVDGPCGGYNLQWAFSSGTMAGRAAASWTKKFFEKFSAICLTLFFFALYSF